MFNIFQGDKRILTTVCKALGYEQTEENITYGWFTEDIYPQTYLYLNKRFGKGSPYDEDKEAGAWTFKVKEFIIQIRMCSSIVSFMVYGRKGSTTVHSPYVVICNREHHKKRELLINMFATEYTPTEQKLLSEQFKLFAAEKEIDADITEEVFDKTYSMQWFEWINDYNNRILNIDSKEIEQKYGTIYQNAYTRHALRTLEKFLHNMLTPIYIRDVPYNIKGRLSNQRASDFDRYRDNIKILYQED